MEISTITWTWLILGGVLLASEIFTGTFHLLFFGLAALITAAAAQWFLPEVVAQITLFAALALLGLWFVQKRGVRNTAKGFEADVAQTVILSKALKAGGEGTIQYQGSPWTAINQSSTDLEAGQRVSIIKTEGVRLFVQPAKENP